MLRNRLRPTAVALTLLFALPLMALSAAPGGKVRLGISYFGDLVGVDDGDGAEVILYEDRDFSRLAVTVWLDTTGPLLGDFYGYSSTGSDGNGPLPLGARRVGDLVGRSFQVVDASGRVVIASQLPKVKGPNSQMFGGAFMRGAPPFRLYIADKKGTLRDIAELQVLPQQ
ncbi:MAG: hypothetical protein ACYTGZ_05360 [Planctomycetota bacterium]|jgi:hypothetical protein